MGRWSGSFIKPSYNYKPSARKVSPEIIAGLSRLGSFDRRSKKMIAFGVASIIRTFAI